VAYSLGYRFDVAAYQASWQFYAVSVLVELVVLTVCFFALLAGIHLLRRRKGIRVPA
jgi:hypothetical protein